MKGANLTSGRTSFIPFSISTWYPVLIVGLVRDGSVGGSRHNPNRQLRRREVRNRTFCRNLFVLLHRAYAPDPFIPI